MSQHTPSSRPFRSVHRTVPCGRCNLVALEVALGLAGAVDRLSIPRGLSHVRDHLVRAVDNAALRLSEASGRTLGNRSQHLEAAYAEVQEVQTALSLIETAAGAGQLSCAGTAPRALQRAFMCQNGDSWQWLGSKPTPGEVHRR